VVVGGHLVGLGPGDLDVEAADLVVLDAQVGDAGALPLPRLHGHEEAAAVGLQGAQFVQFRVVAVGDDAALAQHRCRLGLDGAAQAGAGLARGNPCGGRGTLEDFSRRLQDAGQVGQAGQAVAQARQVPGAGRFQGHPGGDALQVRHALELVAHHAARLGVCR
jgi:hypothetical protein